MAETRQSPARLVSRKPGRSPTRRLDDLIAFQLRRAQEASFAAFSRRVGDNHIWPGWFALLAIIHDNPNINQTELSAVSRRDKSTLTASLRQLVKEGLVLREQDPKDARRYQLSLTELGEAHLSKLKVHAHAHDRRLDDIVGSENKKVLVEILKRLADELAHD